MSIGLVNKRITGVLVPVFSLRTSEQAGCGELLDLVDFGDFCSRAGLELIQLLPINDTGDDPSPYSALSAHALHPIYVRVQEVPEFSSKKTPPDVLKKLANLKQSYDYSERVRYREVFYGKIEILKDLYRVHEDSILSDPGFKTWLDANPWAIPYGVFRALKDRAQLRAWYEWPEYRSVDGKTITGLWDSRDLPAQFWAWVQFRLEEQLLRAKKALAERGILLKGDIPILMNEDSVDVWANPEFFRPELRAGAPPDMFSALGQNWGFPVYNWEALESADFSWWRERLRRAAVFYDAYRIDHVLGFFRIWATSQDNHTAALGYFDPARRITSAMLREAGFDDGRIRWLAEPHLSGATLRGKFGQEGFALISHCFEQLGNEDLYLFAPVVTGEKYFDDLGISEDLADWLKELYRDRSLVKLDDGTYALTWLYRDCSRFKGLSDAEKAALDRISAQLGADNEGIWAENGRKLLSFMRETVPMITCAEDLGAVPDCVPIVLRDLDIYSLKVPRWTRYWSQEGQPFVEPKAYPKLSVCAPSAHDTSTLRDWWEHEPGAAEFWQSLGLRGGAPRDYTPEVAGKVLGALAKAGSEILVHQLQDLFALSAAFRVEDSRQERMNIPGTVQDSNWSYRMPMEVSELSGNPDFLGRVKHLTGLR